MDLPTEPSPPRRSSRTTGSSNSSSSSSPATYGYHNTFHTHAQLPIGNPPTYACATNPQTLRYLNDKAHAELAARRTERLPPAYSCSVEIGGIMGVRQELSTPFEVASSREWNDVYVMLRGTKLSIHRLKNPSLFSKDRSPVAGRLIKSYTLQHAEVGVASDFKKTPLIPKSPFAHMVPKSAREKLYETDPHLFEPVREHVIRLRLEVEQFLLCANSQESMLSWVEQLCSAIDISPPLEDRSEPRSRSLPRRSRRQRVLDGSRLGENLENLSEMEAGQRIIAEQERIIRQLYPHLAGPILPDADEPTTASRAVDHEQDDFDPEDVRFPTRRPDSSSLNRSESRNGDEIDHERPSSSASDPKLAPRIEPSASQVLRYRRRCAPVLLASSPRVSDVVFYDGKRMRLDVKEHNLVEYTSHPPRYDAHHFPKSKSKRSKSERNRQSPRATTKPTPPPLQTDQHTSPHRLASDDSITFGYDLASTSSEHAIDEIQSAGSSGPPSPTTLTRAKEDATHQLVSLDKRRNSDESRENRLGTVTMGVGLLI